MMHTQPDEHTVGLVVLRKHLVNGSRIVRGAAVTKITIVDSAPERQTWMCAGTYLGLSVWNTS